MVSVFLDLRLASHAQARERHSRQPLFANRFLAHLAQAERGLFEPFQGLLNLVKRLLLVRHEAQCEFAVEIVRTGVGHVRAVTAQLTGGIPLTALQVVAGEKIHFVDQIIAQIYQQPLVPCCLLLRQLDLARLLDGRRRLRLLCDRFHLLDLRRA